MYLVIEFLFQQQLPISEPLQIRAQRVRGHQASRPQVKPQQGIRRLRQPPVPGRQLQGQQLPGVAQLE